MSLFSRLFKSSSNALAQELEDLYTDNMYNPLMGITKDEFRKDVHKSIQGCIMQGKKEGTAELSGDFGFRILEEAKDGVSNTGKIAGKIVNNARAEGATDEDIAEWWDMNDLARRMVLWSEEVLRFSTFSSFVEQGMSSSEAMIKVRKMFPMYGDPNDTRHVSGDDRLLPNELRGRIDSYRNRLGPIVINEMMKQYSTYNALVRSEIQKGNL